ncbi:MAG TPA: hypothetical protein VEY94_07195 [Patescibacteria group bacterium]|nr:hypothetical protein [Patescibacteria group bacterium]
MPSREALHEEIRLMASDCAVCERDARDAERDLGIKLDLEGIAHPEDAFAYDLIPHRRELHREKLLRKIREFGSL